LRSVVKAPKAWKRSPSQSAGSKSVSTTLRKEWRMVSSTGLQCPRGRCRREVVLEEAGREGVDAPAEVVRSTICGVAKAFVRDVEVAVLRVEVRRVGVGGIGDVYAIGS
jgi:hypothetical protein